MPLFTYKAKQGPHRTEEGVIDAFSRAEAADVLSSRGLVPIYIEEKQGGGAEKQKRWARRIKQRDVVVFTYQLASLTRSGVPILRALSTIRAQTEHARFKRLVGDIEGSIRDGQMLSEALQRHGAHFPELYVSMVRSGESGGVLDTVLTRLAEAMDKEEETRRSVQSAVAYPLLTLSVGLLTVFILLTFFLPRVLSLFDEYESLPLPTRILVGTSAFCQANWYWLVFGALLVAAIFRRMATHERGRLYVDGLKLKLPLIGTFILLTDIARFSRTLALLLQSGLSIDRVLLLGAQTASNHVLREEIDGVRQQTVSQGIPFSEGMKQAHHIPVFVANMSAVGEEGGRLDEALDEVAAFYERQIERQCRLAISLLEPVLILVVGALVGFIVAAMLLPIFELGTRL
ncbi:MAG: type II secretion system F family protein [Kiritimatiellae bacterium]|nr:type II secretion system F family protein [Kiritimatiellia bacterium]